MTDLPLSFQCLAKPAIPDFGQRYVLWPASRITQVDISSKDGSDLFKLANDFSVRISTIPKPLALRVQGSRGSLKQISERISTLKRVMAVQRTTY